MSWLKSLCTELPLLAEGMDSVEDQKGASLESHLKKKEKDCKLRLSNFISTSKKNDQKIHL
jgi:hypothetical protein